MLVQRSLYALVAHWGTSDAAWPWLGPALAKTDRIELGTGVTAPISRYNPAVVAQVFATLG
jgi:alkanesulfonate monooxygenase SsuD/methylene tetrahydromethanopterin reductase-like flavin-dependent oxidoreductase (luciferase family)